MIPRIRRPVVVLGAVLCLWYGLLQCVPHAHVDADVPQELLACSASHPLSQESHLHGAGEAMTSHACLACQFGSAVTWPPPLISDLGEASSPVGETTWVLDLRSHHRGHLPFHRGPPKLA